MTGLREGSWKDELGLCLERWEEGDAGGRSGTAPPTMRGGRGNDTGEDELYRLKLLWLAGLPGAPSVNEPAETSRAIMASGGLSKEDEDPPASSGP